MLHIRRFKKEKKSCVKQKDSIAAVRHDIRALYDYSLSRLNDVNDLFYERQSVVSETENLLKILRG